MTDEPELPRAVIARIVKDALPAGVNVSKDARLAIANAARVFILYTTATANDVARQNGKKTLSAQDILDALAEMEFNEFIDPLNETLDAFRQSLNEKKERKKAIQAEKEAAQKAAQEQLPEDESNEQQDTPMDDTADAADVDGPNEMTAEAEGEVAPDDSADAAADKEQALPGDTAMATQKDDTA